MPINKKDTVKLAEFKPRLIQWLLDWGDHCRESDNYKWVKRDENVYQKLEKRRKDLHRDYYYKTRYGKK